MIPLPPRPLSVFIGFGLRDHFGKKTICYNTLWLCTKAQKILFCQLYPTGLNQIHQNTHKKIRLKLKILNPCTGKNLQIFGSGSQALHSSFLSSLKQLLCNVVLWGPKILHILNLLSLNILQFFSILKKTLRDECMLFYQTMIIKQIRLL